MSNHATPIAPPLSYAVDLEREVTFQVFSRLKTPHPDTPDSFFTRHINLGLNAMPGCALTLTIHAEEESHRADGALHWRDVSDAELSLSAEHLPQLIDALRRLYEQATAGGLVEIAGGRDRVSVCEPASRVA